ncbi:MAG: hypothetical protein JO275_00100 [Verrucomicrobia bacterium]|nr:hypothetical protein [Verrucomicrobiota bacterium]
MANPLYADQTEDEDDEYEDEALPRRGACLFNQIAQRGLKQILDWEKALGQSSNRTLER